MMPPKGFKFEKKPGMRHTETQKARHRQSEVAYRASYIDFPSICEPKKTCHKSCTKAPSACSATSLSQCLKWIEWNRVMLHAPLLDFTMHVLLGGRVS